MQVPEGIALLMALGAPPAGAAGALPRHGVAGGGVEAGAAVLAPRAPRPRRARCTSTENVCTKVPDPKLLIKNQHSDAPIGLHTKSSGRDPNDLLGFGLQS